MTNALTTAEAERYDHLVGVIHHGMETFVEVGRALLAIRDERLYRNTHATFESWCQAVPGISRPRAYELMNAAEVSAFADIANESQARELAPLRKDPDAMADAWSEANAAAARKGRPVTAVDVRAAVSSRPTAEQREARRDAAVSLADRGFKRNAIADALGVSHGTVDSDLLARGHDKLGRKATRVDDAPAIDWRNLESPPDPPKRKESRPTEPPPATPPWRLSRLVGPATVLHEYVAEEDGVGAHAWAVWAAMEAAKGGEGVDVETMEDARAWLRETTKLLAALADEVGRLHQATTDRAYREKCRRTTEGKEVMRRARLRAVPS